MGSQVFLPDKSVSRQHAVIYVSGDGNWVLEDLDSVNKTILNRNPIHKHPLKEGDSIKIGDFSIKIFLEDDPDEIPKKPSMHLDDTVANIDSDVNTEIRQPSAHDSSMIKMPAKRSKDFLKFSTILCSIRNFDRLHRQLIDIMFSQFTAYEVWVGLRRDSQGDLDVDGGRKINTETVKRGQLIMASKITEAMDKGRYILVPKFPRGQIRSAIIAPVMSGRKCYGAVYVANSKQYKQYDMTDLDYLMLLTIQVAAIIETL
jgi:pSer/pThr/pTyr-binding forkhead associated (FHA) protein